MQAVDEHGRKDGTPAALSFDVGYPPCLQCIEVLPKTYHAPPQFDETLECLADTEPGTIEAHPCFGDTTVMRVTATVSATTTSSSSNRLTCWCTKSPGIPRWKLDPGQGSE